MENKHQQIEDVLLNDLNSNTNHQSHITRTDSSHYSGNVVSIRGGHRGYQKIKQPQERYGAGPASFTDNNGNYTADVENLKDALIMEKATLTRNHYCWYYYQELSSSKNKIKKGSQNSANKSHGSNNNQAQQL